MMKAMKRRRTAAEWSELVSDWRSSGKSAKAFAAERGLNAGTLSWWGRQLLRTGEARSGPTSGAAIVERPRRMSFSEVQVRPDGDSGARAVCTRVEVVTRSGHVVRVDRGFDVGVFHAVLKAVAAC